MSTLQSCSGYLLFLGVFVLLMVRYHSFGMLDRSGRTFSVISLCFFLFQYLFESMNGFIILVTGFFFFFGKFFHVVVDSFDSGNYSFLASRCILLIFIP